MPQVPHKLKLDYRGKPAVTRREMIEDFHKSSMLCFSGGKYEAGIKQRYRDDIRAK